MDLRTDRRTNPLIEMLDASKKGRVRKNDREATRAENERIEMTNRTDKRREANIGKEQKRNKCWM